MKKKSSKKLHLFKFKSDLMKYLNLNENQEYSINQIHLELTKQLSINFDLFPDLKNYAHYPYLYIMKNMIKKYINRECYYMYNNYIVLNDNKHKFIDEIMIAI